MINTKHSLLPTTNEPKSSNGYNHKSINFDTVLQELFSWNPEWLQDKMLTQLPIQELPEGAQPSRKGTDSRLDYVRRHVQRLHKELYIQLYQTFRKQIETPGGPPLLKYPIYINDCQNCGHQGLNRQLECFALRDVENDVKPFAKVNDICILSLSVIKTTSNRRLTSKQYFGLIVEHSMLETHKLEPRILEVLDSDWPLEAIKRGYLLCDRYTIITKRSTESSIACKHMAGVLVVPCGGIILHQLENLVSGSLTTGSSSTSSTAGGGGGGSGPLTNRSSRPVQKQLLVDLMTGMAMVKQPIQQPGKFFALKLNRDIQEMIKQSCDLAALMLITGASRLMAIDLQDDRLRRNLLCNTIEKTCRQYAEYTEKVRFLVITESIETGNKWRERLKYMGAGGPRSPLRVWLLDKGRGWTRHADVRRMSRTGAHMLGQACVERLRNMGDDDDQDVLSELTDHHKELVYRRRVYREVMDACEYPVFNKIDSTRLMPAVYIARERLFNKAYENLLKSHNIVIATFKTALNCPQLLAQPFDSCIIDSAHELAGDTYPMSVLHTGVRCMILAGDSDRLPPPVVFTTPNGPSTPPPPVVSLFHRCLQNKK